MSVKKNHSILGERKPISRKMVEIRINLKETSTYVSEHRANSEEMFVFIQGVLEI